MFARGSGGANLAGKPGGAWALLTMETGCVELGPWKAMLVRAVVALERNWLDGAVGVLGSRQAEWECVPCGNLIDRY